MLVLAPDSYGRQKSLRCGKLVLVACTAVPARPCPAQLGARSGKHRSENHFFATVRKAATIKRSPPFISRILIGEQVETVEVVVEHVENGEKA